MTKRSKKAESFIRTPGYPGGRKALNEFIRKNLKYPKEALEKRIEGKVRVKFRLDQKGKVYEANVVEGVGYGCDKEALRVVKLMKFKAVKNRGVKATFEKTITIPFVLPKEKPKSGSQKLVYEMKETEPQKKVYNYTITINKNS